jgi:hypothetical protein
MALMKNLTRSTLDEIGAAFGGRDHSTVSHGLAALDKDFEPQAKDDPGSMALATSCRDIPYLRSEIIRRAREAGPIVQTPSVRDDLPFALAPEAKEEERYKTELERSYARHLEDLKGRGEIRHWAYEPFVLLLPGDMKYTPDFLVVGNDRVIALHETKGTPMGIRDAKTKYRLARATHPYFLFLWVTRDSPCEPWILSPEPSGV